jgi:hypothetical protein
MSTRVSDADYIAINDLMARYCWYVDDNRADDWAALWTEDGVFAGIGPQPVAGREAIRALPPMIFKATGGKNRHMYGNMYCDYGENRDTVTAHLTNFVTSWQSGGAFGSMALCKMTLVRDGQDWKIKRNEATVLR